MAITKQTERRVLILQPSNAEVSTNQVYAARYEWPINGELTFPAPAIIDSLRHTDAAFSIYRVDVSVETGGTSQYQITIKSYDTAGLNPVTHVDEYITITGNKNRVSIPVLSAAVPENSSLELIVFESSVGTPASDMTVTLIAEDFAGIVPERQGHRIIDHSDVVMAQRPDVKFQNMAVSDDAGNGRTIVKGLEIEDSGNVILPYEPTLHFSNLDSVDDNANTRTSVSVRSTKYQLKELTSSQTGGGAITSLQFSNLTLGKTYRLAGAITMANGDAQTGSVTITNSSTLALVRHRGESGSAGGIASGAVNVIFTAAATSIGVSFSDGGGNSQVLGGSRLTYLVLEELPYHTSTTDWT